MSLRIVGASIEDWSNRYKIHPRKSTCTKCGREVDISTPIAIKGYRGFKSIDHGCGPAYVFFVLIPIEKEDAEFWNAIRSNFYSSE